MKKTFLTSNINLNNYSFTPECTAGGTLLYITNHLFYKSCKDLNLCKVNQLESTFIETINSRKSNIVGCLYKHPVMYVATLITLLIILTLFLINCPKKISKFFFLAILILTLLSFKRQ